MSERQNAFASVKITHKAFVNPSLMHLELDISSTDLAEQFQIPGQYIQLGVGDEKPIYLSMASSPEVGARFGFLIRLLGQAADALRALKIGDAVGISAPAGRGYPLAQATGKDLILLATGTGIAPLRSVIGSVMAQRGDYGAVTLYYGARDQGDLAFADEFAAWAEAGITVKPCLSREPENAWQGHRQYVQDALRADGPKLDGAVAFLCGKKGMVEGAKAVMADLGMALEDMHLNF